MTSKPRYIPVAQRKPLTAQFVRNVLHYDPDSGVVTWTGPSSGHRKTGCRIGSVHDRRGHLGIGIGFERHYLHRLIWLWMTGEWPTIDVDHINGKPADNRWSNLRLATRSENLANRGRSTRSKSGIKGVWFDAERQRWTAEIKLGSQRLRLGRFRTPQAATEAYRKAALRLHGQFARFD